MKARKRFGQHFLVDQGVLDSILRAVRPRASDRLLEIGPGPGALTQRLYPTFSGPFSPASSDTSSGTSPGASSDTVATAGAGAGTAGLNAADAGAPAGAPDATEATHGRFFAVEIDRDLVPTLQARYPHLHLVNDDILRVDLSALLADGGWRIVGNLPYNISTPLLVRLLRHLDRIVDMHFMLQREVAERLAAVPGSKDWGRLTVLTQYHATVEHLFDVGPDSFAPPPRVWSSVVRIRPRATRSSTFPPALDVVLRHAFSQRRKRLSNALQSLPIDWSAAGVDPGKRADAVSVEEYVALAETLDAGALASTETASETDA